MEVMDYASPDIFMLANRYNLLETDHQSFLQSVRKMVYRSLLLHHLRPVCWWLRIKNHPYMNMARFLTLRYYELMKLKLFVSNMMFLLVLRLCSFRLEIKMW